MHMALISRKTRSVLVFLAVVVVFTSVSAGLKTAASSEAAFAAPYQTNPPINWPNGTSYTKAVNPFTAAGWGNQCTAFAWGRAHEVTGISLPFRGNANTWYTTASSLTKGSEPRANSIAVWEGDSTNTAGHVAYIEKVVGDIVSFSEANILTSTSGGGYDRSIKQRSKTLLLNRGKGVGKLLGYLYLAAAPVKTVTPASLKTLAPNGFERWPVGSTQTIRWSYSGDQSSVGGGVRIEVLRGNDVVYTVPASIIIGRDGLGTFGWRIPELPSLPPESTYKVRVVSSTKVSDVSDQPFTLVGPRAVVSADLKVQPSNAPSVNQRIFGNFTIANRGNADLVLNKVTIGGLLDGGCPGECPDFGPIQSRTLRPGKSFKYSGLFIPTRAGIYTFSVAYQKPNLDWVKPVEAENGNVNELKLDVREWKLFGNRNKKGSALIPWFNGDDDKKKIPLILVHGIHESDELSVITNKGESWRRFIAAFNANNDLKKAYAVYSFQYYSDQEGVEALATQLGIAIDNTLGDRPHVLLAHSMGGLVAKSYMVDYHHLSGAWLGSDGGNTTALLITLATPHHGTPAANDADAIDRYIALGWESIFRGGNIYYWIGNENGLLPAITSNAFNRSDLRWDNYDGSIKTDTNPWLGFANRRFQQYKTKVIAYAGVLRDPSVLTGAVTAVQVRLRTLADHQKLLFLNRLLLHGLKSQFGRNDGMVPYYSALLCDKGPFLTDGSDKAFICSSPTRVRRFEAGHAGVILPNEETLSINRRFRGYDHLDMRDDDDVLQWVVKDLLAIRSRVVVSTSLKLSESNGSYMTGEAINGTFTVTNSGASEIKMNHLVIGGRLAGASDQPFDFAPAPSEITLKPGAAVSYSGSFTPTTAGSYTFSAAYENSDGSWTMPVEAENASIKNKLNISVQTNVPRVVVTKSLTVAPGGSPYQLGQTLNGSFSITNRGNTSVAMKQVLIGGRLGNICPNDICPDFSLIPGNVTLAPGQTYDYSGQINLSQPGSYTFYVAYETPDGKWEMPVRPENGTRNTLSVLVQGPTPTLTGVNPSSIGASTNPQTLSLSGTRLAKIIYGELRLPNGTTSYLYIPLRQLVKVTDDQARISAKFPVRGTYYVTVWSLEGKSNSYPITVY
jgi:surface antigen/pimeloyl-ACP methyl ester carboxylesterase